MTRSFLTVRAGATVTHVHCKDMAAMWVSHLIAATVDRRHADVQGPNFPQHGDDERRGRRGGAKLHECSVNTGDADSTQTAQLRECSGTPCDAHSTHTAKLYEGLVNTCDADRRGGPQHAGKSGAPIPEAAHSLGPGQVPKLPARPRRARPGALQAALT